MNLSSRSKTFLDFFPVPELLMISTSGVVVSDDDIRLVQLKTGAFTGRPKLSHYEAFTLLEGSVKSGEINNISEVISVLKALKNKRNLKYVRATIPDEKAYVFTATVGPVPIEGLRDAVAFILEENVPISLAESVFDFEIIHKNRVTGEFKVAVSVVPENFLEDRIEIFESAGLNPIFFDLESQAMARAAVRRGDKRPLIVINIGISKVSFSLIESGVVQFNTVLSYENESALLSNVEGLKEELKKIVLYWESRSGELSESNSVREIKEVVLCGIGASRKNLVEGFLGSSGLDYKDADIVTNLSSVGIPKVPMENPLDYVVPIGLVLPPEQNV